jgi:hypothetical protein
MNNKKQEKYLSVGKFWIFFFTRNRACGVVLERNLRPIRQSIFKQNRLSVHQRVGLKGFSCVETVLDETEPVICT